MKQTCPLCGGNLLATQQDLIMSDVLARWENEVGIMLRESVWKRYTKPEFNTVTLYRCGLCRFAIFLPPVSGDSEFYEDITSINYYVADKWEHRQAIKDLRQIKGRFVLDVGCGSGDFLDLLRNKVSDLYCFGYEINPVAAAQARNKGHQVYDGAFPQAVLDAGFERKFDAITLFQVLEHTDNPAGLLNDLGRLLRPGGVLIVGVPDADGPLRYFTDALTDIPPHHVTRWCESAFRVGVANLGWHVIDVARESLPDYLWESYLPVMWKDHIWPAYFCRLFNLLRRQDELEQIRWFIQLMKRLKVKMLRGVAGHTIYVLLRWEGD